MGMVQDLLVWWGAQLRSLLPARLAQRELHGDALIAEPRPGGAPPALLLRRRGRESLLGTPDAAALRGVLARHRRVLLRVPPGAVLERPLVLPDAAEAELGRVLAYEIDRVSPFAAAELAWTYAVVRRDRVARRLHLTLALLPRAGMEGAIAALRRAGRAPSGVLAPRAGGGMWHLGLRPPGAAGRRGGLAAMAVLCAGLALLATALPFVRQELALRQAEAAIARLRPEIAEVDALRRRIATRAGGSDAVSAEAARTGHVLTVLATLTALLPDDTYLTALSLKQRVLLLTGRSAAAARLIPLLAADPAIRNAAFAAPVTRAEGPRGDQFSIRAEFGL